MNSDQATKIVSGTEPFLIKDCALAAIATGERAQTLRELRDKLRNIQIGSIYYHFWGWRLRPRFEAPQYNNDFAIWARNSLLDAVLAERLSIIYPHDYENLEDLRQELIEVVEERLEEVETVPSAKIGDQFHFVHSQIVVFDTHIRLKSVQELAQAIPRFTTSSIFYHFIDAQRRPPRRVDDFQQWIKAGQQHPELCQQLAGLDPYFATLSELREQLSAIFQNYFEGMES
jgi:Family of unknown function (DUF5752)